MLGNVVVNQTLLDDLVRVDELRTAAALAAPGIVRITAAASEHGASRAEALAAIGLSRIVADWCGRQLRILREGEAPHP